MTTEKSGSGVDQERSTASSKATAGRELDALIAEKVMGFWYADTQWWGPHPSMPGERAYASVCTSDRLFGASYRDSDGLPFFSTDLAAAWQVVERMRCTDPAPDERYWKFIDCASYGWRAEFWTVVTENDAPDPTSVGIGNTLPLAICIAALRAFRAPSAVDPSWSIPKRSGT